MLYLTTKPKPYNGKPIAMANDAVTLLGAQNEEVVCLVATFATKDNAVLEVFCFARAKALKRSHSPEIAYWHKGISGPRLGTLLLQSDAPAYRDCIIT